MIDVEESLISIGRSPSMALALLAFDVVVSMDALAVVRWLFSMLWFRCIDELSIISDTLGFLIAPAVLDSTNSTFSGKESSGASATTGEWLKSESLVHVDTHCDWGVCGDDVGDSGIIDVDAGGICVVSAPVDETAAVVFPISDAEVAGEWNCANATQWDGMPIGWSIVRSRLYSLSNIISSAMENGHD